MSGSGKTTYFLNALRDSKAKYKFIFDHEGEFAQRAKIKAAHTVPEMNAGLTVDGLCLFDPCYTWPGRTEAAFKFFCDYAFTLSTQLRGQKLFACDELQKLSGSGKYEIPQELTTILETGRRYELDFIGIAQSPNLINTRIRAQMTEIVVFKLIDKRALQFVTDCGLDENEIRELKPGKFVALGLNTGQVRRGKVF
jgi:hypothetical protein